MQFSHGAPLGGSSPLPEFRQDRPDRRDLFLSAVLLVAAIVAGASSLMPWRDYALLYSDRVPETGWVASDGTMGRGWVTVLLAVLVATAGVLVAARRTRSGRILALACGIALMAASVIEWGIGDGGGYNGPGLGLWVELVTGVVVLLAIGMIEPSGTPRPIRDE